MPNTPAQSAFYLYGWHTNTWANSSRPATTGLTATPTALPKAASVVVQLPANSPNAKVTAQAGKRSGAPDHRSGSAQVTGGGSVTLIVPDLETNKVHYVRAVATYPDGTQALTPVETQVTPT